jgi:small-conductance mechanosensitive channel
MFHVSYDSDPELVRRVLALAAENHKHVLPSPAPEVEFVQVGERGLQFRLQVWSREDLKTASALKSDLNFEVWKQLAAAGLTVAPVRVGSFGLHVKAG